jgi:MFS family permease
MDQDTQSLSGPETGQDVSIPAARPSRIPKTFSALRHHNYQLYFSGQLVSVAGTWMQIVAQGWIVYELSHSELTLGIVGFASAIPALLVSPFGGVIVDRFPKRNLLVVTQATAMVLALILAFLTFTGLVEVWHVIALSAMLGLVNAVDGPARQAFVVELVGREDMTNGIALNSMMFNGARIIGPAVAGLVLAAVGSAWCFLLNGLSFIAVIACLLAMKIENPTLPKGTASPLRLLAEGLGYVRRHTDLFALLLLALIFSVFGISYGTILPAFVDQMLRGGPDAFGALNAAAGLGAVIGAFAVARFGDKGHRGPWLFAANIAFPVLLALFAFNRNFYLALLLEFLLGVGFMLQFTLINTLLQTRMDDHMRGRVLSLYTITFFGFSPFGNLAIGVLAESIGLSVTIALSAAVAFVLATLVVLIVPEIRKLR